MLTWKGSALSSMSSIRSPIASSPGALPVFSPPRSVRDGWGHPGDVGQHAVRRGKSCCQLGQPGCNSYPAYRLTLVAMFGASTATSCLAWMCFARCEVISTHVHMYTPDTLRVARHIRPPLHTAFALSEEACASVDHRPSLCLAAGSDALACLGVPCHAVPCFALWSLLSFTSSSTNPPRVRNISRSSRACRTSFGWRAKPPSTVTPSPP